MGRVERGWEWTVKRGEGKVKDGGMGGKGKEWDFQKFKILTVSILCSANLHHRAKFRADRSNRCGDMAFFDFSRWRPSAILDFQKLEILTAHTLRRSKMRYRTKLSANRSMCCGDMAVFFFQEGGRPPSWIFKHWGPKCVTMPNFVQIGRTVA